MQVTIGGTVVTVEHGTLQIVRAVGQRTTGSFQVTDLDGLWRFSQGQPVVVTDDQSNTAFSGIVTDAQRKRETSDPNARIHTIQVADWHYLADKRVAPYSAVGKTAGQIVNDLITNFLSAEGVTAGQIDTGPTVVSLVSNYAFCSDVLDALVQKAGGGWYWVIDDTKALHFRQQTTAPAAPFTLDDALLERDTDKVTAGNPQYRNKQYMLGGVAATAQQTETRKGDGNTVAFTMGYPLNSTPTITVNGTAKTVGILGVDSGKDWYWNEGSNVITQDNSGVKLVSTDTLQVVYIGQYPAVAIASDNAAIATQLAREGAGTGVVEAVAFDTTLTSTDQAFQSAAGYLDKYARDLDTVEALTKTYGFAEGQVVTVNLPSYDITNQAMLIESVTLTDVGPAGAEIGEMYWAIVAKSGPINGGWQQFYRDLAGQAATIIGAITLGQSQTLALLDAVSETWTWTESVTPTIYACPILPMTLPATLC